MNSNACPNNARTVRKRVASLRPSPENLELYRPIDANDPEIIKLANAIRKNGCDPLTITRDNYIVSGHRRHAALVRNGQTIVSCRVLPVRREDMTRDQYVVLLREHNHQRHKSVAEQVREELVDVNPGDAHRELCAMRDKFIHAAAYNGVEVLQIEGTKTRHAISDDKADHVKYIKQVVFTDRRAYWPLSERAVHYALLNYDFLRNISRKLRYLNNDDSYQKTTELISRLRLNRTIPWEAFDDPTRPVQMFRPFTDVRQFIQQECQNIFSGYWRNLLQTQVNHVEVVCEKNTIYNMALSVTKRYQIPTSSARGFASLDMWCDLVVRYARSNKSGLVVIVLSDYDPEGEMIPQVGARTLRDDFHIEEEKLTFIKAGVTRQQIDAHQLPPQNFAKQESSNHQWFVGRNGGDDAVYELEALDPKAMLADLEAVIKNTIDLNLYNREVHEEQKEAAHLVTARKKAIEALKGLGD